MGRRSPPVPLDLQSWVPGPVSPGSFAEETQLPGPQPGCWLPPDSPGPPGQAQPHSRAWWECTGRGLGWGHPQAHCSRSWCFPCASPSPKTAGAQAAFLPAEVTVPLQPPLSRQHNGGTEQSDLLSSGPSMGDQRVAAWPSGTWCQRLSRLRALDGRTAFQVTAITSLWTSSLSDPPRSGTSSALVTTLPLREPGQIEFPNVAPSPHQPAWLLGSFPSDAVVLTLGRTLELSGTLARYGCPGRTPAGRI